MSTEDTPAPDLDKPEVTETSAPDGTSADVEQLQRSYDELRSKFNERDSELSELRQFRQSLADPTSQADILREFGIELADDEPEVAEDDDLDFRDPRVDKLLEQMETERQQRDAERAQSQFRDDFDSQVVAIEEHEGRELNEKEIAILHDRALVRALQGEEPSVEALYKDLDEVWEGRKASYVDSKKASRVASGRSASKQPNLDNERERQEFIASRWAALED